jgi:hypothetical protein
MNLPSAFPLEMLPPSPNNLDNILQYTAVASNALQDLATATQIPFLNSISTLSSTIIPIVQVWPSNRQLHISSHEILGNEISKGPMPWHDGRDSPVALHSHEPVHPLG